jgi:hypothetical protein
VLVFGILGALAGCRPGQGGTPSASVADTEKPGWSTSFRGNEVGTIRFVPVKAAEGGPQRAPGDATWQGLYSALAADPDAITLLKRLCRADAVEVTSAKEPAPADWLPAAPPSERSVAFRVRPVGGLGPVDRHDQTYPVRVAHDFFRTGTWEPTPIAGNLHILDLVASDYLLRKKSGWVVFENPPARGEEWTSQRWRTEVDKRIKEAGEGK